MEYVEKFLALADEVGLPRDLLIVDHADEEIVKLVTESGAYAAITIRPTGIRPDDVARIVGKFGSEKILVNSDAAGQPWPASMLAVPEAAFAMRRHGLNEADIEKVVFKNPLNLFKLNV
jgi:predicted metal-dependent TIM-barrel fold hydrolase